MFNRRRRLVLPVLGLLLALTACSSSTNSTNNNATATASATKASTSVSSAQTPATARTAAAGTATPAAAAGALTPAATKPAQRLKVVFGGLGETIDAPLFIAKEKGFFEDQNLDVEVQTFQSLAQMIPLLATGKLDAAHGGTNPGFFNAINTGIQIKIVSNVAVPLPPGPGIKNSQFIVVRKDEADQIKTVADLKGKKVAINNLNTLSQFQLEAALMANGLKPEDVTIQAVPFQEMTSALANKAVDAAVALDPTVTQMADANIGVPIYDVATATGSHPAQYLFYGPDFIKNNAEAGRRLMVAYLKSMRYLQDGWVKGINKDEVIALHIKNTAIKDPALWARIGRAYMETTCSVDTQAIEQDQDFYLKKMVQMKKVDTKSMTDLSFCDYAIKQVGPYKAQ